MATEAMRKAIQKYQKAKARVVLWLDPEEKKMIVSAAGNEGKSVTQWIKDIVMEKIGS